MRFRHITIFSFNFLFKMKNIFIVAGLVVSKNQRGPIPEDEKRMLDEDDEVENIMDYAEEGGTTRNDNWYRKPRDEMRGVAVVQEPNYVNASRPERKFTFFTNQ